jgi:hypothetical protein
MEPHDSFFAISKIGLLYARCLFWFTSPKNMRRTSDVRFRLCSLENGHAYWTMCVSLFQNHWKTKAWSPALFSPKNIDGLVYGCSILKIVKVYSMYAPSLSGSRKRNLKNSCMCPCLESINCFEDWVLALLPPYSISYRLMAGYFKKSKTLCLMCLLALDSKRTLLTESWACTLLPPKSQAIELHGWRLPNTTYTQRYLFRVGLH